MRVSFLLVTIGVLSLACAGGDTEEDTDKPGLFEDPDGDGDGWNYDEDCDDTNPDVHPEAVELCDIADVDEDCDGMADNADADAQGGITTYHDADGDGFGEDGTDTPACEAVPGYSAYNGDCDDADPRVNPDAVEICDADDVDEDCNGQADDADPDVLATDKVTAWEDADADGYGNAGVSEAWCDVPDGWAVDATDCDDGAAATNPGAVEVCNGTDDDCDGATDDPSAADAGTWYLDDDGDGFGTSAVAEVACEAPAGFVVDGADCDDAAADVSPDALESCDGVDDDCDGSVDEDSAVDVLTWYVDADGDGYGDATTTDIDCDQPSGYVADATDCDDAASGTHPGAAEVCDAADTDEDCDTRADDDDTSVAAAGKTTFYRDADADTYGSATVSVSLCDVPTGYVTNDDDCRDSNAAINPAASEVCDSSDTDEDCDSLADDADSSVDTSGRSTFYVDADGDGYGVSTSSVSRCDQPSGYSAYTTDCDDTNAARSPARTEVCDASNTDEDCDSLADDSDTSVSAATKSTWYVDADADGYGVTTSGTITRCDQPAGYASAITDCDDADSVVNPGADEICFDATDDNCDAITVCEGTYADAALTMTGEALYNYAGYAVASAGDQNGDGIDDIAVGAPENVGLRNDSGATYILYGGDTGSLNLSAADAVLEGSGYVGNSANDLAGLGDVNADGWDDLLVAAYGEDDGGANAGNVYYVRGPLTATSTLAAYTTKFIGENASDVAGTAVAAPGDVSGDGKPDILIGAPGRSTNAGAAYLSVNPSSGTVDLSAATAILTGESSGDYAGIEVAGAGDVNGDGYDDFLVGAYRDDNAGGSDAGAAYLVLGPQTGTASLSTADAKWTGDDDYDHAGWALGGGDMDDDGYSDIAIGAPDNAVSAYGKVYVFEGPHTGTSSVTTADAIFAGTSGDFGRVLAMNGDVDGDGRADLLVTDPTNDEGTSNGGMVWGFVGPFSGTTSASTADVFVSGRSSSKLGSSIAFIGAQDGGPTSDFLVGAPEYTFSAGVEGQAYVFTSSGF